jgi:hypothetical protein
MFYLSADEKLVEAVDWHRMEAAKSRAGSQRGGAQTWSSLLSRMSLRLVSLGARLVSYGLPPYEPAAAKLTVVGG